MGCESTPGRLACQLGRRGRRAASASSSTRNRINVAISRARCRVELVCSPVLLEADVMTVGQMQLVNALCRFVELAASAQDLSAQRRTGRPPAG